MKNIKYTFILLGLLSFFTACEDQFSDDLVKDNRPAIPVTYPGAATNGFNPYYSVSLSQGGSIEIKFSVPGGSGRTIKEITKVIAGATSITPGNVTSNSVASYITAPIAGSGNTATFTTTVEEFNSKVAASARIPATITASTTGASVIQTVPATPPFVERAFMFLVTLDDNTTIIPVQCRIRVSQ